MRVRNWRHWGHCCATRIKLRGEGCDPVTAYDSTTPRNFCNYSRSTRHRGFYRSRAIDIAEMAQISFWDALIVAGSLATTKTTLSRPC
jgi:hypothetical protein